MEECLISSLNYRVPQAESLDSGIILRLKPPDCLPRVGSFPQPFLWVAYDRTVSCLYAYQSRLVLMMEQGLSVYNHEQNCRL